MVFYFNFYAVFVARELNCFSFPFLKFPWRLRFVFMLPLWLVKLELLQKNKELGD